MPELIIDPMPDSPEVVTLHTTNAELIAKLKRQKERSAEQESASAEKDTRHLAAMTAKDSEHQTALAAKDAEIAKLQTTVRQITIDGPLRDMAEEMSKAPDLWLEQFSKSYKVEMVDGKLTVLTSDGKPSGIPFEREALAKHLTDDSFAQSVSFKAITITSRASGAATTGTQRRTAPAPASKPKLQFGLR